MLVLLRIAPGAFRSLVLRFAKHTDVLSGSLGCVEVNAKGMGRVH